MKKVIVWFLGFTKLGKVINPAQRFLSGKKAYIAGLSIAIPALLTMIQRFSDQGISYLLSIAGTPEFLEFMNGLGIMGLRAAISKAANPANDPNATKS